MRQPPRLWFWKVPVEQEVDEELDFHLEAHTRDLIARGMDPQAAREAARRRLGDLQRLKRTCVQLGRKRDRTMRLTQWLDDARDDVRFAFRQLRRSPGFTSVAVLTLALGIGANSALFALADATLLRQLPFPDPERLVMLHEVSTRNPTGLVGPFEIAPWAARARQLESVAGIGRMRRVITGPDGVGEQIDAQRVSARFFDVFKVVPIAGRTFLPTDDRSDADAVVISEGIWRDRFGGDPGVVGRRIKLDTDWYTVIGVTPASFQVLEASSAWTLMPTSFMQSPAGLGHYLSSVGRLAPRASLASAQAEMSTIAAQLAAERPDVSKDHGVRIEPLHDGLINTDLRLTAKLLLGVVGFVLLTCCANVANLVLARTSGRARELGVRSALGAGGRRIARLLMTESLLLATAAAVLGAGLGAAILTTAPSSLPASVLPVDVALTFDMRVVAFCAVTGVVLALAFGAVPAWQALHLPPRQAIASGGRTVTGGGSRFRSVLAILEIAVAVVLLCGAGLLLRSLIALGHADAGFRPSELLTMNVNLPFVRPNAPAGTPYATLDSRRNFYKAIEREVRSTAGVANFTWGSAMPLDGWWTGYGFRREGDPPLPEDQWDGTRYQAVGPSYFDMLGIRVISGRAFTATDTDRSVPVCVVNEAFARRYLRDRSPVGSRVTVRAMYTGGGPLPVREIVGVVGSVKERPDEESAQPQLYVPVAQEVPLQLTLVVEPTSGSTASLAPAVRAAVARVDKERPVANVRTLAAISYRATSPARFRATIVGMFAVLALTLAIVGVFGVLAYSVQQRVREFGVRIALGATTGKVLRMVFAGTARMLTAGVLAGLIGAALLARSISSFLFGVTPLDPVTFGSVATLLALTAVCATLIPALRAARVDPLVALRDE